MGPELAGGGEVLAGSGLPHRGASWAASSTVAWQTRAVASVWPGRDALPLLGKAGAVANCDFLTRDSETKINRQIIFFRCFCTDYGEKMVKKKGVFFLFILNTEKFCCVKYDNIKTYLVLY